MALLHECVHLRWHNNTCWYLFWCFQTCSDFWFVLYSESDVTLRSQSILLKMLWLLPQTQRNAGRLGEITTPCAPSAEYPAQRTLTDSSLKRSVFISLSYFLTFTLTCPVVRRGGFQAQPARSLHAVTLQWVMDGGFRRAAVPRWALLLRVLHTACSSVKCVFKRTCLCVSVWPPFTPSLFIHLAFNDRSIRHLG